VRPWHDVAKNQGGDIIEKASRAEELEQKRSFWKQHIESWRESGLAQNAYCLRHDLKPHQLTYWKKRFCGKEAGVFFVPLQLINPCSDSLCLVIHDHFKVEIRPGFDPGLLRQLVLALSGPVRSRRMGSGCTLFCYIIMHGCGPEKPAR